MVHDLEGDAFVSSVDQVSGIKRCFFLEPARWRASRVKMPLTWQEVPFSPGGVSRVPKTKGVYAFVLRHVNNHFPPHGFILYVGITGHLRNGRTLYDRAKDYLREQKKNKRPRVHYMLNKYKDDLFFNFVPIAGAGVDLEELEVDLNDALMPPVGQKDFSASMRAVKTALW